MARVDDLHPRQHARIGRMTSRGLAAVGNRTFARATLTKRLFGDILGCISIKARSLGPPFETTGPEYGNTEHINGDEQDFDDDKLGLGAIRR
jgi:hypothetical protein